MSANKDFDRLLSTENRSDFATENARFRGDLTGTQAQQLSRHIVAIDPPQSSIKFAFVHTYTSDLLTPWFELQAAIEGFSADTHHAPYGLNIMEATPGSALARYEPDLTLMMFQREDLHPDLNRPVSCFERQEQDSLAQEAIENLVNIVGQFRAVLTGRIVITILPAIQPPGLGLFDIQAPMSEAAWWARLKMGLAKRIGDSVESTLLLDLDEVLAEHGRQTFFDLRFWYSARFPFSAVSAREFARRTVSLAVSAKLTKAKVIVLDADNTLWGGIIGEDGMEGIALGPDYPGNTYVEFQRRLLGLQQRGFILALCSKNNPEDVDEVLNQHPHQVLHDEHFAARRVNWDPKHQNLMLIAEELNLGLDSFIFVDDSDFECELVRRELPQVQVIQMPTKPLAVPSVLDQVARLEITSLTVEDRTKTAMYAQERQRREYQGQYSTATTDIASYLNSLSMVLTVELDNSANVARLAQLTQKTNQFNLTTRRYAEDHLAKLIASDDWLVGSFSLEDKFGHSGIVGLAMLEFKGTKDVRLDNFLMSCRTIGRKADSAFLETLFHSVLERGYKRVIGEYLPTAKNSLVETFLSDHNFEPIADGRYTRDLNKMQPAEKTDFPMEIILLQD